MGFNYPKSRKCVFCLLKDKIPKYLERLTEDFQDPFYKKRLFRKDRHFSPSGYPKPCHKLNFCPYNSLVCALKESRELTEFTCKLYNKECPILYLGFNASEKKYLETEITPIY